MRRNSTRLCRFAPLVLVLSLVVTICLAGLWWRIVRAERSRVGVVIVTLDTTRADRLSVYGFMDAAMPTLERIAREGVVFDQAISVAPLTLPAHCSLFTGLYPPAHGVRDNVDRPLAPEYTTLAEILRARGFRTGAFVGSVVLDADRGLAQGFDHYSGVSADVAAGDKTTAHHRQRRASEVIDDAERWLDGVAGARFFLWAHLYDPHRPYDPPEPYRTKYSDAYTGEIAFADDQIGRLLDALERRHLLDRTLVIVVGDHGEGLGEHGERDHGVFVYENVLRVPLIIRAPGLAPGRIANVVRLVDVMPTVLEVMGVPAPGTDGVSLVELMQGRRRQADLDAYSESMYPERFGWSPLRALRAGRFKFIDAPRPELYDLERDPFEQRNVFEERGDLAGTLRQRLTAFERDRSAQSAGAHEPAPSVELQQRLAALGYVGSASPRAAGGSSNLPDPKDCIANLQGVEERTVPAIAPCRPVR